MRVVLKGTGGPLAGRTFELKKGDRVVIGRDPKVEVSVADMDLSRRHCELSWDGTVCRVMDLKSTNGTLVNGEKVDGAALKHGDDVQTGRSVLRVEMLGLDDGDAEPRMRASAVNPPNRPAAAGADNVRSVDAAGMHAANPMVEPAAPVARPFSRPQSGSMQRNRAAQIMPEIVEQHVEEAAFLWLLRDLAVTAPHYSLADLAQLDDRVEAHIDGLRIAGDPGWEICKQALAQREPGEVFAATVLALDRNSDNDLREALEVATASPELSRAAISAFGWLPLKQVEPRIRLLLGADAPALRYIGVAAAAVQRYDPGRALATTLQDTDGRVRARALRAVGELGRVDLIAVARRGLTGDDPECRFSAAWSTALLGGDTAAIHTLQGLAEREGAHAVQALQVALRLMDLPAASAWLRRLETNPRLGRRAVIGAGIIGDPQSVPRLIERMASEDLARVAGESFSMITGADIGYEHLERSRPVELASGPTESATDENVGLDEDENLPWPDPELIGKWWEGHQSGFHKQSRYLLGKKIEVEALREVLRSARQRQRAAAALELAVREPKRGLLEVRAPGFRQGSDSR